MEKPLGSKSKILFKCLPQKKKFAHLLQGKSCCIDELKPPNQLIGHKPLLRNLLLQMDNYVKDNNNCYLLAFLSLLITRKMFGEVKLKFLIVGHKPDNIDGCFGYLLKKLKEQNNLYVGKFEEGFHGLIRVTLHFVVDPRDSKFLNLGCRLFEEWS
jgi:hypothetical protein